jgi:PAS domain S-box-containing protein
MMFSKRIFYCLLFAVVTLPLFAQRPELRFKHLTVDDGLSQSWIHCIYQDKFGYVWFGTEDGLNRYDGDEIVQYKYNSRDTNTICNNTIYCINGDTLGNLWIGTQKGLNMFDRSKNIFRQEAAWPHSPISAIKSDKFKNMWVCTRGKIYRYNPYSHDFATYEPLVLLNRELQKKGKNLGDLYFTTLNFDRKNRLWIGTNKGICLLNQKTGTLTGYFQLDTDSANFGKYSIIEIFADHENRLWIGHTNGLILCKIDNKDQLKEHVIHFKNQLYNPQSLSMGDVLAINEDINQNLWVGVLNGGINILDLKEFSKGKTEFKHYKNNPFESNSLNNNSIYSIIIDNNQNVWIGTFGKGVNMYSPYSNNFKLFRNEPINKNTLNNSQVFSFLDDGNYVWIGSGGAGLDRYDKRDNTFTFFPNDRTNKSNKEIGGVWAMLKDKTGDIWVGTWAEGFKRFNPQTGDFVRYTNNSADSSSISSNNVFALYEDKEENIWIGTNGGGLNKFNRHTNKFVRFNSLNTRGMGNYIESIAADKYGNLWLACEEALACFNPKTGIVKTYHQNKNDNASLSGIKIYMVFCDSKSNLWIGTDVGLNLYRPETDNFTSYQIQDGLPDNAIKSIAEDKLGNLWLGTNKGLSKFTGAVNIPRTPVFKNYTRDDGLQSNEFIKHSCHAGANGTLYFGGEGGFNIFDPQKLKENKNTPNIVFSDFLLFNKSVNIKTEESPLTKNICLTKVIKLNSRQSVFTIKFVALNYVKSSKNQYAYIMEGYEPNWNYVGSKHEATYTSLPAGSYIFKVKASNNDGVWNEEGISMNFEILPPWWKTWWFKLVLILAFAGIAVSTAIRFMGNVKHIANQTILNERNQLKTLINNIPDRIIIKDNKLRYIVLNKATIDFWGGRNEADYINKTDYDFYPRELADQLHEEDRRILQSRTPIVNEESKQNWNGKDIYISTTKGPIVNQKGEIIGLVCILRDITRPKMAEQRIIKQSEELREYNEILNKTNRLLKGRQQQVEEQSAELMTQAENLQENNKLLEEKQRCIQEQSDKLEKTNKQLSALNATKDRLFSIIAHDLRNPFHIVKGFAELLLLKYDNLTDEKAKKYIELIYSSSHTGSNLLENLLNWSRTQTGNINFKITPVMFDELIKQTFSFVVTSAQRKNITLKYASNTDIPLFVDSDMMLTIFRNLVSNAIKFTSDGGTITVTYTLEDSFSVISVKDTGIGISPENKQKLFGMNSNFSTNGTNNEQGTGLGLIICKEFIEKHGGKIWVESEEGVGSEFKFTIPTA